MLSAAILRKTKGFTQQKSLQHAAVLFSGKAGVHLIALLSQPILARLYSPADFGEFAFLNSLLAILLVASSGRYEAGIVLTRRPQHAKRLFQLCQGILAGYVLLVSLLLLLAPASLYGWLGKQGLALSYLWLIPFLLLCAGYWEIVHNWLVRFQKYSRISFALLAQRILITAAAVMAFFLPIPGNGLIFGLLTGSIGIFVIALFLQKESVRLSSKGIKTYAHHFREFPYFSVPSVYVLLFIQHLPILWLSHFFNQSTTGAYSLAITLVMLPLTALMMSAGQVYYQRISQTELSGQPAIIRKYLSAFLLVLAPFSLFLFLWAESFIPWFLGAHWQQAGYFATLLAPLGLFQGLSSCLTIPLTVFRRQKVFLGLQLLKLLLFGAALAAGYAFMDVGLTFKLLSLASLLHLIIVAGVVLPLMKRKYQANKHP